jgi:hypothetical protein
MDVWCLCMCARVFFYVYVQVEALQRADHLPRGPTKCRRSNKLK